MAAAAPFGLPLKHKILPEFLNDLGYNSFAIGKWHLGSFSAKYTPIFRGFPSHVGYWTGHLDYYNHTAQEHMDIMVINSFFMPLFSCEKH